MDTAAQETSKSTPAGEHKSIKAVLEKINEIAKEAGVSPLTNPHVFWTDEDQAALVRLINRFSKAETDGLVVVESEDIVVLVKYLTLLALRTDYHAKLFTNLRDDVADIIKRLDTRTEILRQKYNEVVKVPADIIKRLDTRTEILCQKYNEVVKVLQEDDGHDDLETIQAAFPISKK